MISSWHIAQNGDLFDLFFYHSFTVERDHEKNITVHAHNNRGESFEMGKFDCVGDAKEYIKFIYQKLIENCEVKNN